MFDRDLGIADKVIEFRKKTGFPKKFHVNYTKNSNLKIFEINKRMNEYGMSKGATLSFQSFSPDVLKNIRRTNMTFEQFSNLMSLYNSHNIMTYSELILGLPGETYESFKAGLGKLLEAGQHTSIIVFNCYWLVNSEMGQPEYVKEHKIQTILAPMHQTHCLPPNKNSLIEYSPMVVSTSTMNRIMWVKTALLAYCFQSFHCFGLLQYLAIYFYYEHGLKYEDFYQRLIDWLESNSNTVSGSVFVAIRSELKKASEGKGNWFYLNSIFGDITWPFEEGMFLELAYHSKSFYFEIRDFLLSFNADDAILNDLLRYQEDMLKLPGKTNGSFSYNYDFPTYFKNIFAGNKQLLKTVKNTVKLTGQDIPKQWDRYAIEIVWFGRRGGKNLHSEIEQTFY
jgi:putative methyltransferase